MKQRARKKLLRKLLLSNRRSTRLWAALAALCIGTTLLLLSVMIWWNFQQLLNGKGDNDSLGSTFLTISKRVTNENMGQNRLTLFTPKETDALRGAPQVQDVGVLTSNHFPVYATLNNRIGFSTEMFLEAVPDRFIDKKPVDWFWQPSTAQVPLIVSSEFLNLYNYGFAISKGLPQLSASSIKSLAFDLQVGAGERQYTYTAHVVGFSDRITSVLVPQSFIDYGNKVYGLESVSFPSRLIVKVKDPSDKEFVKYLEARDYTTYSEQLRWNKLRTVVEVVTTATGVLAALLMGIGALVFILFIELTIARAQASISLLLQLGYSPRYLSGFMIRRFFPLLIITEGLSIGIAAGVQAFCAQKIQVLNLSIPIYPGWPVWIAVGLSTVLLLSLVSGSIVGAISSNAKFKS